MSYVGGKSKNGAHCLRVLNDPCFDGWHYVEPFVGMAHLLRRVHSKASYAAADVDELLVTLLSAVQRGVPLPSVTRERYAELKRGGGTALERAVAAFQYSFNGKKFGGFVHTYTRSDGRVDDIPASRARYYASLRANPVFQQTRLVCADYRAATPLSRNTLIMCDPPYKGTLGYGTAFDSTAFWQWAAAMSERCVVLVCEYEAPLPWIELGRSDKRCCVSGGHRQTRRVERLFAHPLALARVHLGPSAHDRALMGLSPS